MNFYFTVTVLVENDEFFFPLFFECHFSFSQNNDLIRFMIQNFPINFPSLFLGLVSDFAQPEKPKRAVI